MDANWWIWLLISGGNPQVANIRVSSEQLFKAKLHEAVVNTTGFDFYLARVLSISKLLNARSVNRLTLWDAVLTDSWSDVRHDWRLLYFYRADTLTKYLKTDEWKHWRSERLHDALKPFSEIQVQQTLSRDAYQNYPDSYQGDLDEHREMYSLRALYYAYSQADSLDKMHKNYNDSLVAEEVIKRWGIIIAAITALHRVKRF